MLPTSHTFKSHDQTAIHYHKWTPAAPSDKAALLFHRGHEHSLRWQQTVEDLNLEGFTLYAWDQRGHGQSEGKRGHAPNLAAIIKDADEFARHLQRTDNLNLRDTAVIAHSVGAVIASAWVHDYAPPIRALVLATPAFRVKLYIPLALSALRLKENLLGTGIVKSYVKPGMLTRDREQQLVYGNDPMVFREIATNVLIDLHDTSTRLLKDAGAITTPTLVLAADRDWVVKQKPQFNFYRDLGSTHKLFHVLRGFQHAVFHEANRKQVTDRVRAFILDAFARPLQTNHLLDADKQGGGRTRAEFDRLSAPTRSLLWALQRAFLKHVGPLSNGVKLGWTSGFDSGVTLDYIYENTPRGRTPLGKLIDRNYLNAIGWRGIRIRRENLQRTLRRAIDTVHQSGRPVRILDTAAGAGRYILETIHHAPGIPISAHLRDYKPENLRAAEAHINRLGLTTVTTQQADAFDRASIASTFPRPNIAIVSGLYELFPDNAPLRQSLAGLADALEPGGLLIYTNQPWHPQMEFIARVLTNREGRPWIMRRRTQAEMDQLVAAAGFEKLGQQIDQWGIFTVSLARRLPE